MMIDMVIKWAVMDAAAAATTVAVVVAATGTAATAGHGDTHDGYYNSR